MKLRIVSGVVGSLVLVFSVGWPQLIRSAESFIPGELGGYFSFLGILLGMYLLFYSMTGDWLPSRAKRNRRH